MRPLVIDEKIKKTIAEVIKFAEANKFPIEEMRKRAKGELFVAGDDLRFCCFFEVGYKVVFTIEEQEFGWSKHLSVSVKSETDKLPSGPAISMLMQEFGIDKKMEECFVYIEYTQPKAVNIISKI